MVKDSGMEQKTRQVYSLGKRHVFRSHLKESRKGFGQRGRGRSFHVDGPKNRKGAGTNSGESGARNLEAETSESMRSRVERMGECVKLKTVTKITWWSACDTVIAQSVSLVLNSLLDWEPVKKLKQRCEVVSFTFFSMRQVAQFCLWQRLFLYIWYCIHVPTNTPFPLLESFTLFTTAMTYTSVPIFSIM